MILDAIASFMCFIVTIACFVVHVLSSTKRGHWINLPEYVRFGFFVLGGTMMYRGINLAVLSAEVPPISLGHINLEGIVALTVMTYTFTALSVHVLRRTFPTRVWDRLNYIERLACCSNNGALAILASFGVKVVPPKAPVQALSEDFRKQLQSTFPVEK